MYRAWCWTNPEGSNTFNGHFEPQLSDFIACFFVFNLQPAAGCHIYDLERQATAFPDWDISHTNLEESLVQFRAAMINRLCNNYRVVILFKFIKVFNSVEELFTFGIISGVKLKKFNWVVWKTVNINPVLQHNDDPETTKTTPSVTLHATSVF